MGGRSNQILLENRCKSGKINVHVDYTYNKRAVYLSFQKQSSGDVL